jgi:aminoglycoside 3-N-acetyltransferase
MPTLLTVAGAPALAAAAGMGEYPGAGSKPVAVVGLVERRMASGRTVSQAEIAEGLGSLGVARGDVLLVHSSLSSFGYVEGGAEAVIDALLDAVGAGGSVLVPTLTWDCIHAGNPLFDHRTTASCVGRIPETFRRRPDARRGLHPTHSCAGIGPMTERLLEAHETQVTPCGSKSPYQRLMRCGGKIVFLGVDLRVNTSFHALEEMAVLPWLFGRFEMLYTVDYSGRQLEVPSRRHSQNMPRDYEKMEPVLRRAGVLVKGRIGDAEVRVLDAADMERAVMPMLAEDPFLLLTREAARRERARFGAGG